MPDWPHRLFDLVFIPAMEEKLDELANLAEDEEWDYQNTDPEGHNKPILFNYLQYTYQRLAEEDKIQISDDGQAFTLNTGLVTPNQEPLFLYATTNRNPDGQPWFFTGWRRKGEAELSRFPKLPEMANYFDDPKSLVFDTRKDLRTNIEHIVADNKERFPEPYRSMDNYVLQTFLKGAIDNAKERIRRNYKTAIPQYYRGRIQLLLPLCLSNANTADLAIVAEDHGEFYRASTCLTLDMAYNNARQLARPDRDWLLP